MRTPWSKWPLRSRKLDPLGYVYVIEFAVGPATIVKVSRTDSPRTRAKQHEYDVSRFGGRIARAWLSEPHLHWHVVERLLIERATMLGLKLGGVRSTSSMSHSSSLSPWRRGSSPSRWS